MSGFSLHLLFLVPLLVFSRSFYNGAFHTATLNKFKVRVLRKGLFAAACIGQALCIMLERKPPKSQRIDNYEKEI